jgi:hypothetical protein
MNCLISRVKFKDSTSVVLKFEGYLLHRAVNIVVVVGLTFYKGTKDG